jgi:hypothetical protein
VAAFVSPMLQLLGGPALGSIASATAPSSNFHLPLVE